MSPTQHARDWIKSNGLSWRSASPNHQVARSGLLERMRFATDSCRLRERLAVGLAHVKDVHAAESEDGLGSVGLILTLGVTVHQ